MVQLHSDMTLTKELLKLLEDFCGFSLF